MLSGFLYPWGGGKTHEPLHFISYAFSLVVEGGLLFSCVACGLLIVVASFIGAHRL